MRKFLYIFGCFVFAMPACTKNRSCECKNANGAYYAGEIETTRSQAKKHCKNLSDGSTECYLKK